MRLGWILQRTRSSRSQRLLPGFQPWENLSPRQGASAVELVTPTDTENWKCRGDFFEFRKGRLFVDPYVRSSSGRSLQIGFQDWCALGSRNFFEVDLHSLAALKNGSSTRSTHVPDPLHLFSQHSHQIALSTDNRYGYRQRVRPPGFSASHFQRLHVVGGKAQRGHNSRHSIHDPREQVGSLAPVHPSRESVQDFHLAVECGAANCIRIPYSETAPSMRAGHCYPR